MTNIDNLIEKLHGYELEEEEKFNPWPECGCHVTSNFYGGGGEKCVNKECGYWFCY